MEYSVNGRTLGSSEEQRDLGVFVHRFLKDAGQVNRVVKKTYGTLALISRGIDYKSREVMLELYKTLVTSQLEYHVQLWSPHYIKDVIALERVQRILHGVKDLGYEERLDWLGFSLEQRWLMRLWGMDQVNRKQLFPLFEGSITRGYNFEVRGKGLRGFEENKFQLET